MPIYCNLQGLNQMVIKLREKKIDLRHIDKTHSGHKNEL